MIITEGDVATNLRKPTLFPKQRRFCCQKNVSSSESSQCSIVLGGASQLMWLITTVVQLIG